MMSIDYDPNDETLLPERQRDYLAGVEDAAKALLASRLPRAAPWREFAPAWVGDGRSERGRSWLLGFARSWNLVAAKKGWPEWTRLAETPP